MADSDGSGVKATRGAGFDDCVVIEVRNRLDGSWLDGFEIVDSADAWSRFRLRRLSDGYVLPALFSADDLLAP